MTKPIPSRVRAMYQAYQQPDQTLATVSERFGVSKNAVWLAFCRHGLPMRPGGRQRRHEPVPLPPTTRAFCGQCERRVCGEDAERCSSRFCKAPEFLKSDGWRKLAGIGCRHSGAGQVIVEQAQC